MNWLVPEYNIVPENRLDPIERIIIDSNPKQNICVKGIAGTRKALVILYLVRKVIRVEPSARIAVLALNNLIVNQYRVAFKELGCNVIIMTYYSFKKNSQNYEYIYCDNVQNISSSTLSEIHKRANYVFVTMDPYITLFETDPLENEPTVTMCQIEQLLVPKTFELDLTYQTFSIQRLVSKILRINPFVELKKFNSFSKIDTQVRICKAQTEEEELHYIIREALKCLRRGYSCAILLPTHSSILFFIQGLLSVEGKQSWTIQINKWGKTDYSALNRYLEKNDVPIQCLGNGYEDFTDSQNKINILTYYSCLGLKFDNVYIPYMNSDMFINSNEKISRNAFVLALTVCRNNIFFTYNGVQHEYLSELEADCWKFDIHEALSSNSNSVNIFEGF